MLCDQIESLEERKLNYISIGFSPELSERKTLCSLQFRFEYLVNNNLELFHFQYILNILMTFLWLAETKTLCTISVK